MTNYNPNKNLSGLRGSYKPESEKRTVVWRGVNYTESEKLEIEKAFEILGKKTKKRFSQAGFIHDVVLSAVREIN